MAIVEGLITAGASLLGGLFGKKKAPKPKMALGHSKTWGDVNLPVLVKQAEANGFNPLTIIRSGGMNHYARTQTQTQGKGGANGSAVATQSSSGSSAGEAVANAIHAGLSVFREDQAVAAQQAQQQRLIDAQLAQQRTAGRFLETPVRVTSGSTTVAGVGAAGSRVVPTPDPVVGLGKPQAFVVGDAPTVTNPVGHFWESNPHFADVETGSETRWGDGPASWPAAVGVLAADIFWNAKRGLEHFRDNYGSEQRKYDVPSLLAAERAEKRAQRNRDVLADRQKAQRDYYKSLGVSW